MNVGSSDQVLGLVGLPLYYDCRKKKLVNFARPRSSLYYRKNGLNSSVNFNSKVLVLGN